MEKTKRKDPFEAQNSTGSITLLKSTLLQKLGQVVRAEGITMVIRSLMGGGAERVMSTMANYWVKRGVQVVIITSVPPETDAYALDPRVKRVWLRPSKFTFTSHLGFPWSIRALRRQIRIEGHPIVISFMDRTNIPVLLATRAMDVRLIVAERIDPRTQQHSWIKKVCMRFCYPWADAVTVLTENVKAQWAEKFVPADKTHVIHNPVLPLETNAPLPEWVPEKFLCSVGRLHYQKGFDILFHSLPAIFQRFPEYKLVILGEGDERPHLQKLAVDLGIAAHIIMPGFIKNPHSIMSRAFLFVLPSRFEGFPNALVEAMSIGLPVVSADCPSGPAYLIEHENNGLIVPVEDVTALRAAIMRLLEDKRLAASLGAEAKHVCKYCNIDHVMNLWEKLINSLPQ